MRYREALAVLNLNERSTFDDALESYERHACGGVEAGSAGDARDSGIVRPSVVGVEEAFAWLVANRWPEKAERYIRSAEWNRTDADHPDAGPNGDGKPEPPGHSSRFELSAALKFSIYVFGAMLVLSLVLGSKEIGVVTVVIAFVILLRYYIGRLRSRVAEDDV